MQKEEVKAFAEMFIAGYSEGIKEAAKVCDAKSKVWENMITTKNGPAMSAYLVLHHAAGEIRALLPPPPTGADQ